VREPFSNLLLRYRGRAHLTQRELASRVGVGYRSVQDWEAGNNYPSAERLHSLTTALLDANAFTRGHEVDEARVLWDSVADATPRMRVRFDSQWFSGLLQYGTAASARTPAPSDVAAHPASERHEDWGEAPDTTGFVGRSDDLGIVRDWVLDERCRLVCVLGMGGIGKTMLVAQVSLSVARNFERLYWRSLRDAPPLSDWLEAAIGFLSDQQLVPPGTESERLVALIQLLRDRRCLVVLDNCEALLEPGREEGPYREDMVGYGRLIHSLGAAAHQSCIVLTSREAPPELAALGGDAVRTYRLAGLAPKEAQILLAPSQLEGSPEQWAELNERFGGNALALKLVSDSIRELFGGEIGGFLGEAGEINIFGGIRRLIAEQVQRSSPTEQHILRLLAVEREPMSLKRLIATVGPRLGYDTALEGVEALRRRSLVERSETAGSAFMLQSVVLEYVTNQLVEDVSSDVKDGRAERLREQTLIQPHAKDYVRQAQERLIGAPILQRLNSQDGAGIADARLLSLLDHWRGRPPDEQGYGPGNVVNLLRLYRGHLRGLDLSRLSIRQAYLAEVEAQDATLAGAHLSGTVLAEGFDFPGSIALSSDGELLAAGTSTGQVWLWRVADRTSLLAVRGPTGAVWGLSLSADGQLMASSSTDGVARVWRTSTGREIASLEGHTGMLRSVSLSGDGRLLASGGSDGTVRLWQTDTAALLATLEGHTGGIRSVSLSADGRLVASVGTDGLVLLWDARTGQPLEGPHGEIGAIRSVALSADGRLFAVGGTDGMVALWDTALAHPLASLQAQTDEVWGLALSADGHLLASGGTDGVVQLWNTTTAQRIATLQGLASGVWGLRMSGDGGLLASGGTDGAVRLWETRTGRPLATLQGHIGAIRGIALASRGRLLAGVGTDGLVRLWDAETWQPVGILQGHTGELWAVVISADGRVLASAGSDGTVRVWDTMTCRQVALLHGHVGGIRSVALSADGHLLASGGTDGSVRVWDTTAARPIAILRGHAGDVRSVALSADGRLLASGGADATVRVWEPHAARALATLEGHTGEVWSVACRADGQLLASGGVDGQVRIWETARLRTIGTLPSQSGGVLGLAMAADRPDLLAIGGTDGTARIWDITTTQPLASMNGHMGGVPGVALSADAHLLATGSFDGSLKLWDVESGRCLRTLRAERRYERVDITGVTGITEGQRQALLALGAVEGA
jgi:WD40 repeat protein/transcriptional regulator with XRE-family HTH domain